jgi:hypothetical protein
MINAQADGVINRPSEEVFAYVGNLGNDPKWRVSLTESEQVTPGPPAAGTEYRQVAKFLGKRIESTLRVDQYQPSSKLMGRITSGPVLGTFEWTFEPSGSGTRAIWKLDVEAGGVFKMGEFLVSRSIKKQHAEEFANLQKLLEGRG